ncbi:sensor histidine kinase [Novosphingobium soli]|uniref:histidine kinase n=1 Tax=Novosphingobium soli TaxID=574956 RepID=A0ABV6CX06_9SPHN
MKPNEITRRDAAKWIGRSCEGGPLPGIDPAADRLAPAAEDTRKLMETIAAKARLADLGEQTSALAHELRQPLFSIAVANENLRMLLERAEGVNTRTVAAVERIAEQVRRAQTIIDRTLAYASGHGPGAVRAEIGLAVANAAAFMRPLLDAADIDVVVDESVGHTAACVRLCQVEAEQVFVNIVRNAAESIEARRQAGWQGRGRIGISLHLEAEALRCVVADNGAGLSAEICRAAFEPFFTTKPRVGTGLGLHICRQALEKVDGVIRLRPGPGEGAEVVVEVPLSVADT